MLLLPTSSLFPQSLPHHSPHGDHRIILTAHVYGGKTTPDEETGEGCRPEDVGILRERQRDATGDAVTPVLGK